MQKDERTIEQRLKDAGIRQLRRLGGEFSYFCAITAL